MHVLSYLNFTIQIYQFDTRLAIDQDFCILLLLLKIEYKLFQAKNTRGLRSRARFKRDETRRDWRPIPVGPVHDYFFMVPLLGKYREKSLKYIYIYIFFFYVIAFRWTLFVFECICYNFQLQ